MSNMWEVFHSYSRAVREGKVNPLKCPDCEYILSVRDKDGDPVLWCSTEDRYIHPGLNLRDKIKDLVNSATRA